MNWEFLLGLLLPAYGAGYVWLIKSAREDSVMYFALEKHLGRLLLLLIPTLIIGIFAISYLANKVLDIRDTTAAISFICLLMLLVIITIWSFPFFKRITELPPKSTNR